MAMKPTIRETVIRQVELDNLGEVVDVGLLGENPNGDCWDYDWVHDYNNSNHTSYWKTNEHVPVDMLLEAVEKLKTEGVTHIQIYPHGDHESYYLTGVKLEIMPEKDVLEKEKKELKHAVMMNERSLKQEEEKLEDRRKSLQTQKDRLKEL